MDLKDRIKLIMDKTEMTQQDFANKLGISPASLSHVFQGRSNPTNNHVTAIHNAFPSISVSWLMFGEGEMFVSTATEGKVEPIVDTAVEFSDDFSTIQEVTLPANASSSLPIDSSENRQNDSSSMGSLFAQPHVPSVSIESSRTVSASAQTNVSNDVEVIQAIAKLSQDIQKRNEVKEKRVKEIRVFYDDGTYEIFVSPSK